MSLDFRLAGRLGALAALFVVCAAAPGCGKTASSDATDPTVEFVAWDHALNEAWCDKTLRCADVFGPYYSSKAACLESSSHGADYDRYYFGQDHYGDLAGFYHVASAAIRNKCLAAIAASPCDSGPIPECDTVLVLTNPLHDGEPCGAAFVSGGHFGPTAINICGPGLACDGAPCPVCVKDTTPPPRAEDEPCSDTSPCANNLECSNTDGPTRLCKPPEPPPGLGEPCDYTCFGNFVCAAGVCEARRGVGDDCDPDAFDACMSDLHCDELSPGRGVCRPYARSGEPCSRFASTQKAQGSQACIHGLWCVFDEPNATTGVCGGAPALSGPIPCSGFGFVGDELLCPVYSRRDTHGVDDGGGGPVHYCMCVPYQSDGACTYDNECPAGSVCISSKCGTPKEDGTACTDNLECASQFCDLTKGRCASNSCPDGCPGVDRNRDIFNCGDCGHVCDGVAALGSAVGLSVLDATGIYVVGRDDVVLIPLAGGDPVTLATGQFDPRTVTQDRDTLYWASDSATVVGNHTGTVFSLPKSGDKPVTLATGEDSPNLITVDSTNVYWVDAWTTIRAVPLTGGTPVTLAVISTQITSMVADGSTLYAGMNDSTAGGTAGRVVSLSIGGGNPVTLATSSKSVDAVAVYSANVYLVSGGTVASVPIGGGAVTPLAPDQGDVYGLAVDATSVYWANREGIASVPIDGGPVKTVVANPSLQRCVGVDRTSVYWTDSAGISKAPITGAACRGGVCQ